MPKTISNAELLELINARTTFQTAPDSWFTLQEFYEETEKVVWKLQEAVESLRDRVADLSMENDQLKERVEELEDRTDHLTLPGVLQNSPHRFC